MNSRHFLSSLIGFLFLVSVLKSQTTYTFTNAGATGNQGPSQAQVNAAYLSTNLNGLVTTSLGIQSWTVPTTGTYSMTAFGARGTSGGSFTGGSGARMSGTFTLTAGTVLRIAVGQMGLSDGCSGGGGGGSFIVSAPSTPLLIAAGGGGIRSAASQNGCAGNTSNLAGTGSGFSSTWACGLKAAGSGSGGIVSSGTYGAGGGGFFTNGANDTNTGGGSWANNVSGGGGLAQGGFGGGGSGNGGCGGGGGGGYSGGDGGFIAGGGGSFNTGTSQNNAAGVNAGQGYVIITRLAGVSIVQTSNINCNGQLTAVISASATGGTAPYSYSWSPGGSTSQTLSAIGAGTYVCVATDAASIVYTSTYVVTQPPMLTVGLSLQNNVTCNGGSNGLLSVSANGGTGAYTYTWLPSGGSSATASNLTAGSYTCLVQDANACLSTISTNVTQPIPINVIAFATSTVVCQGQSSILIGAGALTYTWTNGVTNGVPFVPTTTNIYTVTGTDAAGCVGSATTSILVNPVPTLAVTGSSILCSGNSTTLGVSGANTYTWSTGSNATLVIVSPVVSTTYTVAGTNSFGCQSSVSKLLTVINSTPVVTANSSNSVICFGNSTTLFGSGAVSYVWSGGITDNVPFVPTITNTYSVTGSNACGTATAAITVVVNNLPTITANASSTAICIGGSVTLFGGGGLTYTWTGGVSNNVPFSPSSTNNYSLTGTDANGCQNTASKTVLVNLLPNVTANVSNSVVCFGSTIIFTGGGALTYTWTGGVTDGISFFPTVTNTYSVTGTDINGCVNSAARTVSVLNIPIVTASVSNSTICGGSATTFFGGGASTYTWSNGIVNGVPFVPLGSGVFSVTGSNLCGSGSATVAVNVNTAPPVTASAVNTAVCIGSSATLFGGGALTYTWSNGVINNSAFFPTVTLTYTVTGTDAIGCQNTATQQIVVNALPTITANTTNALVCNGYTTSLFGSGALTYSWTGGVTNAVPFTPSVTSTYTVIGTNVNGCQNSAVRTITVNQLPNVTANASGTVICSGNGVSVFGGGANTYTWSGGVSNGSVFFPSSTSTYSVFGTNTITGCTNSVAAVTTISVNSAPSITTSASNSVICRGQSTILNAIGANSFTWTGGVTSGIPISPTITTNYFVTGTSTLTGCSNIAMQTISVNPIPTVIANASNPVICNGFTTSLIGTGADTYTWTGGALNGIPFIPLVSSNYTVTGTNTLTGCSNTNLAQVSIVVNPLPNLNVIVTNSSVCEGNSAILFATGASSYSWSGGVVNGSPFFPTASTIYTCVGVNFATGCSNSATQAIVVNALPLITINSTATLVCSGSSVSLSGAGANTYTWSGGIQNGVPFNPSSTTSYSVFGTNTLSGCTNTVASSQVISVVALPIVVANASSSMVCIGSTVVLTGSGANTYTWSGGVLNGVPFLPTLSSYTVIGTNTLTGCTSTNVAVQTLGQLSLPNITVSSSNSLICSGETAVLLASGGSSYIWNGGNVGSTYSVAPLATTIYTVTGTNTSGCSNTAVVTQSVSDCLGLSNQIKLQTNILIYPNPNDGEFSITSEVDLQLKLINEIGQLVKEIQLDAQNNYRFEMKDLAKGVYFLIGRNQQSSVQQKIIVTK